MNKITRIMVFVISTAVLCLTFPSATNAKKTAGTTQAETANAIEIKIESTRPRLSVGTGLGITALVKNNLPDSAIHIHEQHIVMAPAPELVGQSYADAWPGFFPTEVFKNLYYSNAVTIPPGDSYKVLWYAATNDQMKASGEEGTLKNTFRDIRSELSFLFFTPGTYSVSVVTKYWIDPERPPDGKYHTAVDTATLSFDAPQSVILFGASLGGLIAYFLLPKARKRLVAAKSTNGQSIPVFLLVKSVREMIGISSAVLLSAIVTILLARISETQFLIRVTVADFWGAVAIGFIANYVGAEVLNKIIQNSGGNFAGPHRAPSQTTTTSTHASGP